MYISAVINVEQPTLGLTILFLCLWPSELQEVKGGPLESAGGIAQNATKSVEEADNETD